MFTMLIGCDRINSEGKFGGEAFNALGTENYRRAVRTTQRADPPTTLLLTLGKRASETAARL
jgi:hypothetical protein